jgi:hypothetical protein
MLALISDMASVEKAVLTGNDASKVLQEAAETPSSEEELNALTELLLAVEEFCLATNIVHIGCKPHKGSTMVRKSVVHSGLLPVATAGRQACLYVNNNYKVEQLYESKQADPQFHVNSRKVCCLIDYSDSRFIATVLCNHRLIENMHIWKEVETVASKPSNADIKPWKSCPIISQTNWDRINDLVTVLEPMEEFIKLHSGHEYPTLNEVIPRILILRSTINQFSFRNSIYRPYPQFQLSQLGLRKIRSEEGKQLIFEVNSQIDEIF